MCDDHKSSINKKIKERFGASLKHGQAHEQQHRTSSRRDFLYRSGLMLAGGSMLLGNTSLSAFNPSPLLSSINDSECGDRILVLIRLKGGNDGLNTIIHRGNDEYYNIRPNIAIQENNLFALSTEFGMPNVMSDLESFWGEGMMKVVHNVGYPDANYSHFRSSDIWASASDSDELISTGWLGRLIENDYQAFLDAPPVIPPALQIGVQANMIFRAAVGNTALAISNPSEFYQIAQSGQLYDINGLSNDYNDQELKFVRNIANSAFRYSETIREAYSNGSNQVNYPQHYLSEQLAIVGRLIKGNLGTKIYMVTIGGFDTHADQIPAHPQLLNNLATAVNSFYTDLAASGHAQNVLTMTFSEFGRTIFENGSMGTDHGTGGPLLVFGEDIGNGFFGEAPDLLTVDEYGDPLYSVDFRSVYSTMLQDWLCVDETVVDYALGNHFDKINDLVPTATPPIGANETAALLGHNPLRSNPAMVEIKYSIYVRGTVRIQLLDSAGHPLRTLVNEFKEKNSYVFTFQKEDYFLPPGQYIYKLDTGGKVYSRPITLR